VASAFHRVGTPAVACPIPSRYWVYPLLGIGLAMAMGGVDANLGIDSEIGDDAESRCLN